LSVGFWKFLVTIPDDKIIISISNTTSLFKAPVSVNLPSPFGIQIENEWIDCVDTFPYLGYIMNIFLGNNDHTSRKRELMFSAARSTGRLLRGLEITNLNTVRTFFFSFVGIVASQQYGVSVIHFQEQDFLKAAKIFLCTIFCLPDSFSFLAVAGILRIRGFELTALQHRLLFIEKGFREGSIIAKVLDLDRTTLANSRVGLPHDLIQFLSQFFDVLDLEDLDIRDFTYLQDLRDQLVVQLKDRHLLAFARSTGLGFWTSLAEDAFLRQSFCLFTGSVDFESCVCCCCSSVPFF
jgi:hypothetical protein